ncbi:PRA1 family protein B4 [Capsicum annuum]|uniref:PRA1 family protein n=1 Tax=Capsicum annuum TaxID=4072 RepID=A0A1U8EFF8_CAPAN|nr:PRA1 family protein B4 [Capsicum annuum]PHT72405.1 PRA1 family protein B4 [Capsicum annuum]
MASPAVLPINNTDTAQQIGPTPAFHSFINHISTTVQTGFANRRPWSELFDRSAFSKPESFSDATLRIQKNYSYFRINYLSLLAAVLAFSLITNPVSLLTLSALLAAWLFLYLFRPSDPPLVLFGRQFSERETLGVLIVSTVAVIFVTSVGAVLVSALMVGLGIVCTHSAFRAPEDLFLDDQESPATGFLSFLGGGATNAAAIAVAPAVAARV